MIAPACRDRAAGESTLVMPLSALALFSLFLVFFLYLWLSGAGMRRALQVVGRAAAFSAVPGAILAILAALIEPRFTANVFLVATLYVAVVALPTVAVQKARDLILGRHGAVEVILLNVLGLSLTAPDSYVHRLMNPFAFLTPHADALNVAIGLWPSLLTIVLVSRQNHDYPRLKFVLALWTHLAALSWLLHLAIYALLDVEVTTPTGYVTFIVTSIALVHVVLSALALRDAVAKKKRAVDGTPRDPAATGIRPLADSLCLETLPASVYLAAGICAYLFAWLLRSYLLDAELAASIGLSTALIAGGIGVKLGPAAPGVSVSPAREASLLVALPNRRSAPFVAAAFLGSIVLLTLGIAIPPVGRGVRGLDIDPSLLLIQAVPESSAPLGCELIADAEPRMRCGDGSWNLDAVKHPAESALPASWNPARARSFGLAFDTSYLSCREIPVRTSQSDGSSGRAMLVLIYRTWTDTGSETAWVVERHASCARLSSGATSDEGRTTYRYRWQDETAAALGARFGVLGPIRTR